MDARHSLLPLSTPDSWRPRRLKRYPHFDKHISPEEAAMLVTDPNRVATHSFFSFIRYVKKWRRYGKKGTVRRERIKAREIRYAARGDSYIFEYYRYILAPLYERALVDRNR